MASLLASDEKHFLSQKVTKLDPYHIRTVILHPQPSYNGHLYNGHFHQSPRWPWWRASTVLTQNWPAPLHIERAESVPLPRQLPSDFQWINPKLVINYLDKNSFFRNSASPFTMPGNSLQAQGISQLFTSLLSKTNFHISFILILTSFAGSPYCKSTQSNFFQNIHRGTVCMKVKWNFCLMCIFTMLLFRIV